MNFKGKMVLFFATGGWIGHIPFAPGTFGTLLGLAACFLLSLTSVSAAAVTTVILILLAVLISEHAEKLLGRKDPGCVVIDEVAGMVVTLLGLPFSPLTVVTGFILFRLLDIWKPLPVRVFQDSLPGGAGVVMDDVAAGVIGNLLLRCIGAVVGV